jgi:hypothetical protein
MNSRNAFIALGKAFCSHIEPDQAVYAEFSDESITTLGYASFSSYNRIKHKKPQPIFLKLSDDSYEELGKLFLRFLNDPNQEIHYSCALLANIKQVYNQSTNYIKEKFTHGMAAAYAMNEQDLIIANACDILSPAEEKAPGFRERLTNLIDEYSEAKQIHGEIMERFKHDHSDALRNKHPQAWAAEFRSDFQIRALFSDFCTTFLVHGIDLASLYSRYSPMTQDHYVEQDRYARDLEYRSVWQSSTKKLIAALRTENPGAALRLVHSMEVSADSPFYSQYIQYRAQTDLLIQKKINQQIEIKSEL